MFYRRGDKALLAPREGRRNHREGRRNHREGRRNHWGDSALLAPREGKRKKCQDCDLTFERKKKR